MKLSRHLTVPILAATLTALVALSFALYTNHAWEDYYITYRASKNLATGHGLVFNVGDRLHTFTSPLGVLLPAVSYLLTANSSDTAALWIFRLMSCIALGGGAAFFVLIARQKKYALIAGAFLVAGLITDSKTMDFSINGMETGFVVLFLAYAFWAHLTSGPRQWKHLGIAWAGLMWTRPDSFIYIGLMAAGFWFFNDEAQSGTSRGKLLGLFFRAGLLTTALYLPWLLFAWGYYGTPEPHTIVAKSGILPSRTLVGVLHTILQLPFNTHPGGNTLGQTFLPAYYMIGGWPKDIIALAQALGTFCALVWLLPFLRLETRAASFAFFGAHVYLTYFPYFPFPWYLPATTVLALLVLGGLIAQACHAAQQWQLAAPGSRRPIRLRFSVKVAVVLFLSVAGWTTWESAREFSAQQKYVETGNRRKIGEWLYANAHKGDTVFMEPLGYIGFFSGLKTYDFPGMSSREMVVARKQVGNDWADLISFLQPTWLVLRPPEVSRLNSHDNTILNHYYTVAKAFDVSKKLGALNIEGLPYLMNDARFTVYHMVKPMGYKIKTIAFKSPFPTSHMMLDGDGVTLVHAPGEMLVEVPGEAKSVTVAFGFPAAAYAPGDPTDGADFQVKWHDDAGDVILMNRTLNPAVIPADRGLQHFTGQLPTQRRGAGKLIFSTSPGQNNNKDWTCWSKPELH